MPKASGTTCPSAPGKPGAILLGRVRPDRTVALATAPLTVSQTFLDVARQQTDRPLEERFRFASSCAQNGCGNWLGGSCSLPDRLMERVTEGRPDVPDCSVRASCRWFHQRGEDVCRICTLVTTRRES